MSLTIERSQLAARLAMTCLAWGVGHGKVVEAAGNSALPGMTYESLRQLPDWSGWWALPEPFSVEFQRHPPQMKRPEDLTAILAARADPAADPDPARYCRPQQFVGANTPYAPNVEFLFTPGRVTITNESGLVRRIYADGSALPADPDPTDTGTSVGHWRGPTLVIETTGIDPEARFPFSFTQGGVAIGRNVRITERISRHGQHLEIEILIVAPDLLAAPYSRKMVYEHVPNKRRAQAMSICSEHDRAFDPVTGTQRFDLTPPADLPPPPPL